jgi:hypothetical protein
MPGFMPGIHVFGARRCTKTWLAGTSPAMTRYSEGAYEEENNGER